jgi:hypothetical protein
MEPKVSDLTVNQLKELISTVVQERIEDVIEDIKSMLDSDYVKSIEEARREYKEGRVTGIDNI